MAKANGGAARGDSGKRNLLRGHTTTLCMIVLLAIIVGLMARIAYLANADMGVLLRDGLAKEAQVMDERVNGQLGVRVMFQKHFCELLRRDCTAGHYQRNAG